MPPPPFDAVLSVNAYSTKVSIDFYGLPYPLMYVCLLSFETVCLAH